MKEILWFNDVTKEDAPKVGGKGANLGEMYQAKFPIPPGFCVTAQAYKRFLEETGIDKHIYGMLKNLNVEDSAKLHETAEKVQEIILDAIMPAGLKFKIQEAYENLSVNIDVFRLAGKKALDIIKAGRDIPFVAVRSSATAEDSPEASFAGQQQTFLNVRGKDDLVAAVQKCWASLFTARAIYYRVQNNFVHEKVLISVVVQKMVNSDKSGVAFTINPSTNADEIVIESGFGLGEVVVSGAITPDEYIIDKKTFEIKNKKISNQNYKIIRDINLGRNVRINLGISEGSMQKLNDTEIKNLAKIAIDIERHYKFPQDIEFAIESGRIYIVQTRPVTTIKKIEEAMEEAVEEIKAVEGGVKAEAITETENKIEERAGKIEEGEGGVVKIEEGIVGIGIEGEIVLRGLGASPHAGTGIVKIVQELGDLDKIIEGDILVAKMTNPDYVPAMKKVHGVITEQGGLTCHSAIVGREMGLAVIVGAENATSLLKDGDVVTVDGVNGIVYKGKKEIAVQKEALTNEALGLKRGEKIDTVTEIKAIVDLPENAESAAKTEADGVGLLRCEFMMLYKNKEHPVHMINTGRKQELVDRLAEDILIIAKAFKNKPVWYRTLDARTDEFKDLIGGEEEPHEDNPMMGWHAIRRDFDEPQLIKAQFEAIKKVHDAGFTNVGVMIPMVTHVEQVRFAKEMLKEVGLEPLEEIEFGVMIETPASVQIIEELCNEGLDFVSIGSNDLTQFTLAIDRNNPKVQNLYDEMHVSVLKQLKHVIKVCREHNVETSICGQAGSKPEMAEFLVKCGIDSVSVNVDVIDHIRRVVFMTEKKLLLRVARDGFR